jgi:DNA polymerase-3 subunit epsilon
MLTRLSLRLRILLFFALLALGGVTIFAAALSVGYRNALTDGLQSGFVIAGLIAGFGFLGLTAGIWLLFDENVAKPIQAMATTLRARAHAGAASEVDQHSARYLGDLAPAADSLSATLETARTDVSEKVASETETLRAELAQLAAILSDLPSAILVLSPQGRIVFYNGAAAAGLAMIAPPRLNAALSDYFDTSNWHADCAQAKALNGTPQEIALHSHDGAITTSAHVRQWGTDGGQMIWFEPPKAKTRAAKAVDLTYDFALMDHVALDALPEQRLEQIPFVVFDCETTGLLPHKDEILQIGAVRVLRNQIIYGEEIDRLLDPGRPIPPTSTRIHHITDAMVAGAPGPKAGVSELHHFARDAVIVAHNAPFDMAFMRRHGNEMGLEWRQPILDTVLLSAILYGPTAQHSLDAICERLGVGIPEHLRHTALGDAQATAQALCKMLPMLSALGHGTLKEVMIQSQKHGRLLDDLN